MYLKTKFALLIINQSALEDTIIKHIDTDIIFSVQSQTLNLGFSGHI